MGRPRNYHLRPFIRLSPLQAGAEALEDDGDDTGDKSKAIKASSHFSLTSLSVLQFCLRSPWTAACTRNVGLLWQEVDQLDTRMRATGKRPVGTFTEKVTPQTKVA